MDVRFAWRGELTDEELFTLTRSHGGAAHTGWWDRIRPHSLGWVTARLGGAASRRLRQPEDEFLMLGAESLWSYRPG